MLPGEVGVGPWWSLVPVAGAGLALPGPAVTCRQPWDRVTPSPSTGCTAVLFLWGFTLTGCLRPMGCVPGPPLWGGSLAALLPRGGNRGLAAHKVLSAAMGIPVL